MRMQKSRMDAVRFNAPSSGRRTRPAISTDAEAPAPKGGQQRRGDSKRSAPLLNHPRLGVAANAGNFPRNGCDQISECVQDTPTNRGHAAE